MPGEKKLSSITLDDLRVHRSVRLYEAAKPLDEDALSRTLGQLKTPGGHSRRLKLTQGGAHIAAVIRKHGHTPSFLAEDTLVETRYSLVLLVAVNHLLAVATVGAGRWRDTYVKKKASKVDPDLIGSLLGENATFQKVRLRSMSLSSAVVRARTLESEQLESAISPQGLNRQIPESATVRQPTRTVSATPTTARFAVAGDRIRVSEFVAWVRSEEKALTRHKQKPQPNLFLARFAQPINMEVLSKRGVSPNGLLLGLDWLVTELEQGTVILERLKSKKWSSLTNGDELVRGLSETAVVSRSGGGYVATSATSELQLRQGKTSFRVSGKSLNATWVRKVATGERHTLARVVNDERSLFVTFDNIEYAYAFGQLFRDPGLSSHVSTLRKVLHPIPVMTSCSSEKGTVAATQKTFGAKSLFSLIEGSISHEATESYLVCDDLGDEWADFIGIGFQENEATVSLYHAKHKATAGSSASALHDVIGQALKNLGRVAVVRNELDAKKRSHWATMWRGQIKRVRRGGTAAAVINAYVTAAQSPALRPRVCLVTSSLSVAVTEEILTKLETGRAEELRPHQTQLLHLLVAFVSQTKEANAEPVIYCEP